MLKFVVYVVVLGICFDQGLTQGASENLGGPPGRPGKRGVPGQKGEVGEKGMKGEAGAPAPKGTNQLKAIQEMLETHSNQIQLLEDKIYSLCKQTTKPENGWYAPNNGYQYKVITTTLTWQESRRSCQNMGADLAAVGMRNLSVRRNLATALFRTSTLTWIGLSDLDYDGQWVWVDEVPATEETAAWLPGEPNDGRYSRCAHINYKTPKYQANDVPCSGRRYNALCEKPINDLC